MVRQRDARVSLATVYNTLEAFVRRGLARRLAPVAREGAALAGSTAGGAPAARYDADTSEHVHFVTDTGRVRDVPSDLGDRTLRSFPPELVDEIERRMGVSIDSVRVELVGRDTPGSAC